MASIMEMSLMCRLCLAKDKNQVNIPIFEDPGDIRQIFVKISSCLPIKISRDDQLPKNICDGCGDKLELLYEFWNTSLDSEKTLTAWLKQVKDPAVSAVTQQISKPAETLVKEETDAAEASTYLEPAQESSINEEAEIEEVEPEEPPKKRARRTAAVKAQINIAPESDDEDDNFDNNMDEPDSVDADVIAKLEGESEESDGDEKDPSFADLPGTSTQDQPGTSGLGKDGAEAPLKYGKIKVIAISDLLKSVEPQADNRHVCPVCNEVTADGARLAEHLKRAHRFNPDPKVECPDCRKLVKSESELRLHVRRMHINLAPTNYCDICGKLMKGSLNYHKRMMHTKEFDFRCELCDKGFVNRSLFRNHQKVVHEQALACPETGCDKVFKSMNAIRYHKDHAHSTILCPQCGQIFSKSGLFKYHLKRHVKDNEMINRLAIGKY